MKKIISTTFIAFSALYSIGQTTVQGSIQPVSTTSSTVIVVIKPNATVTTRVSGVTVCLAVPKSVAGPTRPPITISNIDNPSIAYIQQDGGEQLIGGVMHYTYNVLGTGSVTAAADDHTYTSGVDNPLVRVTFEGDASIKSAIKLANMGADFGGSTFNSYFALSFLGTDVADQTNLFYSIPTVSLATNGTNGDNTNDGNSVVTTTGLVPLPVKFLSFSVAKNNSAALLNWTIENESSLTVKYDVERSTNGIDFSSIATVNARNNGRSSNTYDLTDADLMTIRSSGTVYYKIKQLDLDGRYTYSEIKSVRLGSVKGLAISAFPNPVKDFTKVTLDLLADTDVMIAISDASGKQIQNISMQGLKGLNVKQINFSKFAAGSYNLKVTAGSEVKTISVVKIN